MAKVEPNGLLGKATNPRRSRQDREKQLIEAATKIFSEKGYSAASIQDVADAIGVLKGSLYHYIGSKEDLLYAIFDGAHKEAELLMDSINDMDAPAADKFRSYVEGLVVNALNNLDLTSLYFRDWRHLTGPRLEALVQRRRQYESFHRSLILQVYKEAGIEPGVKPKYVSFFVLGGINWLADWYRPGGADSVGSVAQAYATLATATVMNGGTADMMGGAVLAAGSPGSRSTGTKRR